MKVLIISHMYPNRSNPNSGIFIHSQARHLQRSGCGVRVVAPVPFAPRALWFKTKWKNYGQLPSSDLLDGIPVYYPRYLNLPGRWFHGLSCYSIYESTRRFLDTVVRDFKPDIIHAHTATPGGHPGLRLAVKHRLPFICSLRGSDINIYPYRDRLTMALTREVILGADKILSVSGVLKSLAEDICPVNGKIDVVYNGCDSELFSPDAGFRTILRERLGIGKENRVLMFAGTINASKGVFELLEAFFELSGQYPDLHQVFAGEGPEKGKAETIVSSRNAGGRIHMIGSQTHGEMPKWLNAADIFVLPTHFEGLPNVILEAMSCGLPVISTRVGGIPEVLKDGENGLFASLGDTGSLVKKIKCLLEDVPAAKRMGLAGRDLVRQNFSWDQNAKKVIGIYADILKTRHLK
ncbi:MAG: glycosyltransferase family 4 protein [Nitrospiraceae bacterium]|nr:glycosyltransferase family 4 protein [Nitrospiraceae bacterium]